MTNLSVLKYKAPVVTITMLPMIGKQSFALPISTVFVPQPDGVSATLPTAIGATTPSGTGAVPTAAGSAPAAGSNVAAGGSSKSGSFPSNGFDPKTTVTWAELCGVHAQIGYKFSITTTFSPGMPITGTAVLHSDSGSPTWAGTTVPLNGYFTLSPLQMTAGDVLRVKVTPSSPSAHLIGYSNEIPFTSAGVSFKRVSHTNANTVSQSTVSATGTTNYVWFPAGPRDITSANKLFRINKSTEVVEQVTNINTATTDNVTVLGAIGDVVFFLANNTGGAQKLYSVTEALVITQLSNIRNSAIVTDGILVITPVTDPSTFLEGGGCLLFNNNLYFTAVNSGGATKMFRVNGSGTIVQVTNTTGNQATSDMTTPQVIVFNGNLYSVQNNASGVLKLFKITSADVVTAVGDTRNNAAASDVITLKGATTGFMYYTAQNSSGATKLYKINTSDTPSQATNLANNQATNDTGFTAFSVFNDMFYFIASYNIVGGSKLFKFNGSGTLVNVASPLLKDLDNIGSSDSSATLLKAGDVLFINMQGADNIPMMFYITTSDVVTRADQSLIPTSGTNYNNMVNSFTTGGGRTFVQMSAMIDSARTALFEVLPSTYKLRQVTAAGFNSGNIAQTRMLGHISGSTLWIPLQNWAALNSAQSFIVKVVLT